MKRRFTALGLVASVLLTGALGIDLANGQTPTPTSAPGPTGSVSGRVYVDVDTNGGFGGPDAPLEFPLEVFSMDIGGLALQRINSMPDGTYQFGNLPAGNYRLSINLPVPSCVAPIQPFTWVGDTFSAFTCPSFDLTTQERNVTLAPGEEASGVDFPQNPHTYDVRARIWLNAAPLSAGNRVVVTAGGTSCWDAQITPIVTAAAVTVSFYSATLTSSADPACHGGDLDILIDGRSAGATTDWNEFWLESLYSFGPRPLNQSADTVPYLRSTDLAIPPFLGITGQVAEAGTVTPQNVAQHQGTLVPDDTEVRAFVGATLCGSTLTKALTGRQGEFGGNLFGLIVPPAGVKPGCGTPGTQVTFCIGDFTARQPAAGPFSHFQSPEAKPLQWAAPALADITLEPTTEPCLGAAPTPTPIPGPDRVPISLPATGGRPN
jgi:hypothetical protein